MMRNPCSVSHGSWCWIVCENGMIKAANPPVATTVQAVGKTLRDRYQRAIGTDVRNSQWFRDAIATFGAVRPDG